MFWVEMKLFDCVRVLAIYSQWQSVQEEDP